LLSTSDVIEISDLMCYYFIAGQIDDLACSKLLQRKIIMQELSLLHPQNSDAVYHTLTKEAVNDLSIDYLCESLTKEPYERNSIKQLLINITDDEKVIKYRCDVFDDFLRFPQLRADLTELLEKLNDLREIERFQKDNVAACQSFKRDGRLR
jgi:hypothetical protein